MGVAVDYTYAAWLAAYPEFATVVTEGQFEAMIYPQAQVYCVNSGAGPVSTSATQTVLLGLMCAHIAQLFYGSSTAPLSGITGRISSATEGSVSVQTDMPTATGGIQAWLYQTKYGIAYWAATAQYRTMRYVARPGRPTSPIGRY